MTTAGTATTGEDVMRGVAGAVLLGVPLVYTQEVWSHGAVIEPFAIIAVLLVTLLLNSALSKFVGFRPGTDARTIEDTIVGFGLSALLATAMLALLGRISWNMPAQNSVGIVALTMIPVSIGFSLGSALAPSEGGEGARRFKGELGEILVAAAGALVFALNIAPTQEPLLLASELGVTRLVLVVLASLVLPYLIVFYAEFGGRNERLSSDGATQGPVTETLIAYVVALGVAALLLWAFRGFGATFGIKLAQLAVLAFPASLGSALGRVLV